MNPKKYYYNQFKEHLHEWINKSDFSNEKSLHITDLSDKFLGHIPKEELTFFYCSLSCTILIDQIMYSYFKEDYKKFRELTLYPKMSLSLSVSNANPWWVIRHVKEFKLCGYKEINSLELEKFFNFFINDLDIFFNKSLFKQATWENIKTAMLNDKDISWSESGEIFINTLKKY